MPFVLLNKIKYKFQQISVVILDVTTLFWQPVINLNL